MRLKLGSGQLTFSNEMVARRKLSWDRKKVHWETTETALEGKGGYRLETTARGLALGAFLAHLRHFGAGRVLLWGQCSWTPTLRQGTL